MAPVLTPLQLAQENTRYGGTGGCSAGNRQLGFRPAFLDGDTGRIHLSRFADGRPAPVHLLDGLPPELVAERSASGRVTALKPGVVTGFERGGCFVTREQALQMA